MMRSNLRAAIGLAVALEVILPTAKAETIECRARPESREYWSWRQIEGRRCWFKGHRRIDKKLLSWGPRKPAEGVALDPATFQKGPGRPSGSPVEPIEAEPVYQPPKRLVSSIGPFETAWRNLMSDMKSQDRVKVGER
jgi:hypothetical protein